MAEPRSWVTLALAAAAGVQMLAGSAMAAPATPHPPPPAGIAAMESDSPRGELMREAAGLEKKGRWLGAVATWRELARTPDVSAGEFHTAMERLHNLAGLSWIASVKSRQALPLIVGKDIVAIPYLVKYGDRMRNVVTGVDRVGGRLLWTREDAVAIPHGDDVVVMVQNWQHIARVDNHTGGDMWDHKFPAPQNEGADSPNRKVLGVEGGTAWILGDTWPMALDLATGQARWGPHRESLRGYRATVTAAGVLAWPCPSRPSGVSDAQWQNAPMVFLSKTSGEILWRRNLVAGEPWQVAADGQRIYLNDPKLASEKAWTAVSMDNGQTIWRQPQLDTRPSTLTPTGGVLMEASTVSSSLTRFLDPSSGRRIWQTERMVKFFPQGPVLEANPQGPLTARDIATGTVRWSLAESDDMRLDPTGAIADGNLYMTSYGVGYLSGTTVPGAVAASLRNGQVAWKHHEGDTPYQEELRTLQACGDVVLMERTMRIAQPKLAGKSRTGAVSSLLALDAAQGKIAWGFWDLEPSRTAPPVRVGDTLLVVGNDKDGQTVYAFDLLKIKALTAQGKRWWW